MNKRTDTYRSLQRERTERASREAAEWLHVMQGEPDREEREAFAGWIAASPLHVRELLLANMLDRELSRPGVLDRFDIEAVIAEAKAMTDDNVVSLSQRGQQWAHLSHRSRSRRGGRRTWVAAAASVVLLVVMAWAGLHWQAQTGAIYASVRGEQRSITLVDGTVVVLAPGSRIRVEYSPDMRRVDLQYGEASFSVVHNTARPFRVHAGASVIQDVGTRFSVNRLPSGTVVSVTEGEVQVTLDRLASLNDELQQWVGAWLSAKAAPMELTPSKVEPLRGALSLTAGEVVHLTRNGKFLAQNSVAELTQPTTHTRRLVFHDATLADIAVEFNRYNPKRIMVVGNATKRLRFSGVFDVDDAASFLQFLDCCSALSVIRQHDRILIKPSDSLALRGH